MALGWVTGYTPERVWGLRGRATSLSTSRMNCSRPDLEDVMWFISNILGSGKLILSLIVSISVNDVFWTVRRLGAQEC
jgi:hypothetical protein